MKSRINLNKLEATIKDERLMISLAPKLITNHGTLSRFRS